MDFHAIYLTLSHYWLQISVIISAIAGAVAGIIKFYNSKIKPAVIFIKNQIELPDKIDAIYKEIRPNGGGSIKDVVNKLQASLTKVEKRQIAQYMYNEHPIVETSIEGKVTWVNRAYLRMLNTTFEEVEGSGWKNFIHPDDKARIFREWSEAVADKRDYKASFRFVSTDGNEIEVHSSTLAVGEQGYISFITKGEKHLDKVL